MNNNYDLDNFEPVARIVVIGVGGAGNNAVNRMIDENITAVEFYVANTDRQALATSKAPNRLVLGEELTGGLGAGGDPNVGRAAAEASIDDIRDIVRGANMVFIAAGMGGGTGTGASPIVAQVAKEEGALTVAIVTRPFTFEGKKRIANSVEGLNELKDNVDAIIIVSNDKLLMVSGTQPISEAFSESDRVLAQSVKTVTDLILMPAIINLDFADVRNTLKAICAVTCGPNVSLYEAQETVDRIIEAAGNNLDIKFGVSINDQLSDQILVSVIASDFTEEFDFTSVPSYDRSAIRASIFNSPIKPPDQDENAENLENVEDNVDTNEEENGFLPNFLKNKRNL